MNKFLIIAIISNWGFNMCAQPLDLDSLVYTTAKVVLVEEKWTPCHLSTSYFTFKVIEHIDGPHIDNNTLIITKNLRGYINGDATKIRRELYYCATQEELEANKLVLNFTYNPKSKFSTSDYARLCWNDENYLQYGISYICWAVREERQSEMVRLDKFLESKFNSKFHLMTEREGKFLFKYEEKEMVAVNIFNDWVLAEVK